METYGANIFEELKLTSDWRFSLDTSWSARVETFGANILEERKLTSDWRFQDLCARPGQDTEFGLLLPTGISLRTAVPTDGCRGEAGILRNWEGEPPLARDAPATMGLASRDVGCRAMTVEIREGSGVGPNRDHIFLHLGHLPLETLAERLPGNSETAKMAGGVDVTKEPAPWLPAVHYNMGGIPYSWKTQAVHIAENTCVPGSWAALEAVGASDLGAVRLGTNSLPDLAAFGRLASLATAGLGKPNSPAEQLPKNVGEAPTAHMYKYRQGMGPSPTADRRCVLQVNVQKSAPVGCNTDGWIRVETVFDESEEEVQGCRHHGALHDLEHRPG